MNNKSSHSHIQPHGMDPSIAIPAPIILHGQAPMAYPPGVYPEYVVITGGNDGPL